jgi:hypothetical protein
MPILNISKTLKLMRATISNPVAAHDTPLQQTAPERSRAAEPQMLNCADNKVFRWPTIQRSVL